MTDKRALVLFAPGFEEIETVTIIDVLRRAGIQVVAAGTEAGVLEGAHGIRLTCDANAAELCAADFDAVVLPGGMANARTLASHQEAQRLIHEARDADRVVAAICAAPIALHTAGLLEGRKHTSHPVVQPELPEAGYCDERVVTDGRLVTSRGPGTSLEFALAVVAALAGAPRAAEVAAPMQIA